MGTIVY